MTRKLWSLFPEKMAAGDVGVVMARAGVGKTSFLVRLALETLQDRGQVVHIALGQTLERVHRHYAQLYSDQSPADGSGPGEENFAEIARGRAVQIIADRIIDAAKLQSTLDTFRQHLDIKPSLILIDGADWHPDRTENAWLESLKQVAHEAGACLWLSLLAGPESLEPPEVPQASDLAVLLGQDASGIQLRLLKAYELTPDDEWLELFPKNGKVHQLNPEKFMLLSGAAPGAEEAFGACAERHRVNERNLSFAGRTVARHRGVVQLTAEELQQGEVSFAYIKAHMHRKYRQDDEFRKVLQSIWHQVNPAGEVFAVGSIQKDSTVKGGTGWAVELAKRLGKPVWVYDQARSVWFHFQKGEWQEVEPPVIHREVFAGTGTRKLSENGRQAISDLFERTFGGI